MSRTRNTHIPRKKLKKNAAKKRLIKKIIERKERRIA